MQTWIFVFYHKSILFVFHCSLQILKYSLLIIENNNSIFIVRMLRAKNVEPNLHLNLNKSDAEIVVFAVQWKKEENSGGLPTI